MIFLAVFPAFDRAGWYLRTQIETANDGRVFAGLLPSARLAASQGRGIEFWQTPQNVHYPGSAAATFLVQPVFCGERVKVARAGFGGRLR